MLETLKSVLGNKAEAARILDISRKNLYERLFAAGEGNEDREGCVHT